MRSADGFALFIASTVSVAYQSVVAEALVQAVPERDWLHVRLDPGQTSVLDQCVEASGGVSRPLVVTGFDQAATTHEAMRRLMTGLNYSRPRWKPTFPAPVVMLVGPEAHQALLESAPDFARYRSATVRFLGAPLPSEGEAVYMPWLSVEARRSRMRDLVAALASRSGGPGTNTSKGARPTASKKQDDAGLYADVERAWELALHRLSLGEPPRFEEAVLLASQMTEPRLPSEGRPLVRSLNLPSSGISDVSPLSGLTALQTLGLGGTQVSDVSPLAGLTALQTLNLGRTHVSNVSPLSGLTALQTLWLHRTHVSDVSPLSGLTALQELWLTGTQVSDVSPLSGLTALQTLWLNETQVSDVSPLSRLTALQTLWLTDTQVSDLSPLSGLTALQTLWLNGTQVSDVSPLSGLTALQYLSLTGTQVSDVSPLAGLPNLTNVRLPDGTWWNPQERPPPARFSGPPD